MSYLSPVLAQASTASDGGSNLMSYVIIGAAVSLAAFVSSKLLARRAKARIEGVTGDASDAVAVRIAPAPPFPDDVARLRALVGDTGPAPRITRYTVPVVVVDGDALSIRDKKIGHIVSIPLTEIVAVEARVTAIKPKGTFVAQKFPSLWVTVGRGAEEISVALTPVVGAYDKISLSDAGALAADISSRLIGARR